MLFYSAERDDSLGTMNIISQEEVWVKVGGDKGGGSFKMSFQIGNVSTPNAPPNTFVFDIYEGHDSPSNLHICLDQYRRPDISASKMRRLEILLQTTACT